MDMVPFVLSVVMKLHSWHLEKRLNDGLRDSQILYSHVYLFPCFFDSELLHTHIGFWRLESIHRLHSHLVAPPPIISSSLILTWDHSLVHAVL